MKDSRAEQVFESFISGDRVHLQSPLLSISLPYTLMQTERSAMKRKMRIKKVVALNLHGTIVYNPANEGLAQVTKLLVRAKATALSELDFAIVQNALRNHLGSFGQIRDFVGKANALSFIGGFLDVLERNGIPNPYGETIDDMLRFVNRYYCRSAYTAALSHCPQSMRRNQCWNEDFAYQEDILALDRWTFFKDETEALMLRLSDTKTKGRMAFVKLLPAEAA
jgi:hypothetical protein